MKVEIGAGQLKAIAEHLEAGNRCWYHIPTKEILWAPDDSRFAGVDEAMWADVFNEIEAKAAESIIFEAPDSSEAFKIMADFAEEEVRDPEIQSRLIYALNQRKPFMHFNSAIRYDNSCLQQWYQYKLQCYIKHVKDIISIYNSDWQME